MKIICIAKNYPAHAAEMRPRETFLPEGQSNIPTEPVIFLKPDSALLLKHQPFFYPDFSHDINYELEVVVRICRVGKSIEPRFAHRYYDSLALGIDFTARDLQGQFKAKGQPWALAKGFDGSAVLSEFIPLEGHDINNLEFHLLHNGKEVQHGNTRDMFFPTDTIVSYVSQFMTLRTGDLIYTGTPAGVGPVQVGDLLEGYLEGNKMLECRIK